jgi:NADH-quinone oxidoreductase subunit M
MAAVAGISIILAAVYTLNMIQNIFYGKTVAATEHAVDISNSVKWTLIFLVIVVLILGVYPQPLINLTKDTVNAIVANR